MTYSFTQKHLYKDLWKVIDVLLFEINNQSF